METTQQQQQAAATEVTYSEVNCSQHCRPLGSSGCGPQCKGQGAGPPPPANAPPVREEEWRETADGGAWGVAGEWRVERLASLAARQVVVLDPSWRLLAPRLPHDLVVLLRHAAASSSSSSTRQGEGLTAQGSAVQEKMVRVSEKCVVVCKPLTLGQVIQFEGGYAPAHADSTCPLRFPWQLKALQEFYGLFDGLSLSGDEAWTRGVNLWPLTLCLKSLPGVFGDEDLVQEWVEVQESRGLPRENCCAWPTWLPLGCESDSTIFFINCAPSSPYFGQLRYIVTTVQDDHFLACSLGKFFSILERYVGRTGGGEDAPSLVDWLHRNATSSPAHHHHRGHNTATAAHK